MLYSYLEAIPIVIIIYCLLNIKNKDYFWNLLISIGILPFVALIIISTYSTFNGSGLVGDEGGIDSGLFASVVTFFYFWYIYVGAIILLLFSIKKKERNINKNRNLSIIEKTIMTSIIATNIVFILNWYSVEIFHRPFLLYRLFNNTNNIYYGIGVTVEKIGETSISYHVDFPSLIVFLCIAFAISLIFIKLKKKR